jgi:hypothetical protein
LDCRDGQAQTQQRTFRTMSALSGKRRKPRVNSHVIRILIQTAGLGLIPTRRSKSSLKTAALLSTSVTAKMALVSGYSSDEDDAMSETNVPTTSTARAGISKSVHAAPEVSIEVVFQLRAS